MRLAPWATLGVAAIFGSTHAFLTPVQIPSKTKLSTRGGDDDFGDVSLWRIEKVDKVFGDNADDDDVVPSYPNPLSQKARIPSSWFVDEDDAVAAKVNVDVHQTCIIDEEAAAPAFMLAGPRMEIAFDPEVSRAAIVTCGGLCPGLNTVVREVVMCLRRQYGVENVYGVPEGYRGFQSPEDWRPLDETVVANFHNLGGSVLGSSRGGYDTKAIVDSLAAQNINMLFVIGGDGTLRGAAKIAEEVKKRGLQISVAVIPKTIDNDIPLVDRTFGFETAVEAARDAINVANVEAEGFPLGLGVVKVMGRNSGFIAMHAALGSRVVDLCLVPEVDFYLDGPGGIVDHLAARLLENNKAVVVVAEGAGQDLIAAEQEEEGEQVTDLSGNVMLEDIGRWLADKLKTRLGDKLQNQTKHGDSVSIKYIDPSYMVRGVPPNTADNVYCTHLAHNAVHGAFAGLTSFVVGSVNTRECFVPTRVLVNKRNVIDTEHQSLWEYVVFDTGQPCFQTESDDVDRRKDITISASGGVVLELE
ncbi:phosphofructokinase 5, chloroplastic [Seminavis robusta]|uniref:Phosphofructokinase 5, chloroplastic n=1 Tax=Seminavis robusta TaxID=568900 RepID=A0A9N8EMZ8_9STRA|nr:phosphofructokinase 5, chloroplastic [Seminavis robusta]|eukprot:Sro1259_g256900.1 phosphofructokinase 5, chloroplastic (528) ;mRNA; r:6263-7846